MGACLGRIPGWGAGVRPLLLTRAVPITGLNDRFRCSFLPSNILAKFLRIGQPGEKKPGEKKKAFGKKPWNGAVRA